jgi:hypothetical protein
LSCLHDTLDAAAVTVFAVAIMVQMKKVLVLRTYKSLWYDSPLGEVAWAGPSPGDACASKS